MTEANTLRLQNALDKLVMRFVATVVLGFADFTVFSLPGESTYLQLAKGLAVVLFVCLWVYGAIVWFKTFQVRRELRKARNAA